MADSHVFQEFPKWVYHKHSVPASRQLSRVVHSAVEQAALGEGWIESPQALQLIDAPAVASDDAAPASGTDWIVGSDLLGFLQSHLNEVRSWLNESARFSAFYDPTTGPVLIGGPEDDSERRRQQQRLEELIQQLTYAVGLVRADGGGLDALKTFALDRHFACAHTLTLPGHPVRVDRIGEVLERWCRHLITNALRRTRPVPTRQSALGRNIDRLRKERGWTFEELADKMDLTKEVVNDHINNGARPRVKNLSKYADVFGVTVEELERE
jgi:hypothetical protein